MSTVPAHFQLFRDEIGEWRWRLRAAGNGKIIADSAEGYNTRASCVAGMKIVRDCAETAYIWDMAKEEYVTA